MKIEFITKNYNLKDRLKEVIEKKLSRLDKFFDDSIVIKVNLRKSNMREKMELTIILDGIVLRSEVYSSNMFDNIDVALPKLEKQIIKHRSKLNQKSKAVNLKSIEEDYISEVHDEEHKLVRTKKFALIPMTAEDAIEELELTDHSFYVFLNKDTKAVNVVYMRKDGDYGLIDTVV